MKKAIHFTLVMSLICLIMAFASCKKPEDEEKGLVEITYVANGGNIEVTTHNIEVGMISGLYVPTRDNYKFLGWYKEADFSGETYFNYEATKAEKITLYAKWEIIIDYDKVTNTKAAINALVKIISLEDEDQIIYARTLYDDLNIDEKRLITNYSDLEKAELYLSSLKQIEGYKKDAQTVIDLIDKIGEIIDENEEENINNAKAAYDALSKPARQYVTNYDKLTDSMKKLESYLLNQMYSDAKAMNVMIAKIPSIVSYPDKTYIYEVKDAYDNLRPAAKKYVNLYYKLENALQAIDDIEKNTNQITYVLGNSIYTSREELFIAFMSDYYYFINANFGSVTLETRNIKTCQDFLDYASNYNAGRGQMRAIGDEFAEYYLTRDVNGIMENQSASTFIGYCLENNKHRDFIDFLSRFFAYWRIDEGYANKTNYGADLYAEAWAALVDTCKFFYYTVDTCYVKSERMKDCYNFTSSVVYGELPTLLRGEVKLPTGLKLRGYRFAGWYDSPNYDGEPIKAVKPGQKVILYAKWEKDENQQSVDAASKVEVYIYNLTTEKANITSSTIGYVRSMYDNLTEYGKTLVSNYNELVEIENNTTVQILLGYYNHISTEYYLEKNSSF